MRTMRNRRGLTFVELIAVLVVLVTLALFAMTPFEYEGASLDVAAWGLRANIQYAQDLAMTQNDDFGFNPLSATTYEIYEGAPGVPAKDPLTNDDMTVDMAPAFFQGTPTAVQFDSAGVPDNATAVDIVVQISGGGTRTVRVEPNTGYTRVIGAPGGCSLIIPQGEGR